MQSTSSNNDIKKQITIDQAWHYKILPNEFNNEKLECWIDEGNYNKNLEEELEIVLGKNISLVPKDSSVIHELLIKHYPKSSAQNSSSSYSEALRLNVNDTKFLENLVLEARNLHSSDIHIETYGEKCRIRYRVDGVLIDRHKLNKSEYPTIINKIKIAAACDIAEKRMPQDGRIRLKIDGANLDIRVSILPTLYGEKLVLRLLGSDASHISIHSLGFNEAELARYHTAVRKPNGIILISGPTGSGKTTTLYATLKLINKPSNNILTIEDPIEYTLDGVNQVQLKEDIGLTYTEALRTFLRQDPDVIMLGEIRDAQTAQMAIRAALTGHLVLSTIHTNSAWGTISRLVDMGVPAYLLSGTLNLSVAQRLVRVLCPACKVKKRLNIEELPVNFRGIKTEFHFLAAGCENCLYTGFKGRKAIYEVINITRELSEHIKNNSISVDEYLQANKIDKLSQNALKLYLSGETTLEEIYSYLINDN